MRFTGMVGLVAVAAALLVAVPASAHTLQYRDAKRLAIQLAEQEEAESPSMDDWRIYSPRRTSNHKILFRYESIYDNGRICRSTIAVAFKSRTSFSRVARFGTSVCEGP